MTSFLPLKTELPSNTIKLSNTEIFPPLGPNSSWYRSNNVNEKRRHHEAIDLVETLAPTKVFQVSTTQAKKRAEPKHTLESTSETQDSQKFSDCKTRRGKAPKSSVSKAEDENLVLHFLDFFFPVKGVQEDSSVLSSLIRENLAKTSLTTQTQEVLKLENATQDCPKPEKTHHKVHVPRVESSDNLQCSEDSTAISEQGENSYQEMSLSESPMKTEAVFQSTEACPTSCEDKIVELKVGQEHQVDLDVLNIAKPKRQIKEKWIPNEENSAVLEKIVQYVKGRKVLTFNEEIVIGIMKSHSFDYDNIVKQISKQMGSISSLSRHVTRSRKQIH